MKKVMYLIFLTICALALVNCGSSTKNNVENKEKLKGIVEELGLREYKEIEEIEDRNVFITDDLKITYESYSKTKDENLLIGLKPIDVFRLHNSAKLDGNVDITYSLINYPEDVDKDKFIEEVKNDDVAKINDKKLINSFLDKKSAVYQVIYDDTTAFIVFRGEDDIYRLEWIDPGIWKIGWLARQ